MTVDTFVFLVLGIRGHPGPAGSPGFSDDAAAGNRESNELHGSIQHNGLTDDTAPLNAKSQALALASKLL